MKNEKATRRSIIQAGAAAVGAALLPRVTVASPAVSAATGATPERAIEAVRADYLHQVQELARRLGPRFASGELRGFRVDDFEDGDNGGTSPHFVVEAEAVEFFKLDDSAEGRPAAHLILAVSPSTTRKGADDCQPGFNFASACITHDVIRAVRAQGWYTPALGEEPCDHPAET